MPSSVKSFRTLNYEGSQAKVTQFTTNDAILPDGEILNIASDNEYYNLTPEDGWYVSNITTDLSSTGKVEFKDKEGKWFNRINGSGRSVELTMQDLNEFSVQGLGFMEANAEVSTLGDTLVYLTSDMEDSSAPDVTDSNDNDGPVNPAEDNNAGANEIGDVFLTEG